MTGRSRHTDWIELKNPFQMQTHTNAKQPLNVPSCVWNRLPPTANVTSPAIRADIGSIFQSF